MNAYTWQPDRPRLLGHQQAQQQMAQESGSQHHFVRRRKHRDLAARSTRDDLRFSVQQAGRIESQEALFIGHSIATLATRCAASKAVYSAGNALTRGYLTPKLCDCRLTTAGGVIQIERVELICLRGFDRRVAVGLAVWRLKHVFQIAFCRAVQADIMPCLDSRLCRIARVEYG